MDSTLREGLDTPGVSFDAAQKLRIAKALVEAGVPEAEMVAPSRVVGDLEAAQRVRDSGLPLKTSGLIYANGPNAASEIKEAAACLDRFDLLVPVSTRRKPFGLREKVSVLSDALALATSSRAEVGAGFPHSTQAESGFLIEIARAAAESGAARLTVYDTNGSAEPFSVCELVGRVREAAGVPVYFHGHNDLGLATANALAAVRAGAAGLDVTVNGLGDRAGNAPLEQVALALLLRGHATGVAVGRLRALSEVVARESGVPVPKLAPVVGEFVLRHRSPSHLEHPDLFEAYDPDLIGSKRELEG